ncbi:diacylglycerol acyltransferase [Dichotomocladium elegans]|nr:diacylglycerol acyltransferase [Dichotomocladium elegans]
MTASETAENDKHHVHWAPLNVPLERRLQMLVTITWFFMVWICPIIFIYLMTIRWLWPMLLLYITYITFDKAPETGGRRIEWVRHWGVWKYFANYFPATLIKESELDPKGNYIFGYHPHGIISMGAVASFATEATGFSKQFPGIVPSLLTLTSNFRIPLYRDLILSMGIASVSRESCKAILSSGPGRSIVIVIGGASESLDARPGIADLTLKRRLGFIRMAIKQRASLVPVFSFGENELFDQLENKRGSAVWKFQKRMQAALGFTLPLFHARGVFNYDYGVLPFRHPIATVVGSPITVPELEDGQSEPTKEQLLAVQEEYIKGLMTIYDKYKDVYAKDRKQDLRIVA